MKREPIRNITASVHQRLLNLSRERNEDFNLILTSYTIERLLYRLTCSTYSDAFLLKGAMLITVWLGRSHRPTRDLDLLGIGDAASHHLKQVFQQVCQTQVEDDGLVFDPESIEITVMREEQNYPVQRVKLQARLGKARIRVQVDIGFGDAVTPEPEQIEYPVLLELPRPRIRAYPRETVVAEKLQTLIYLGMVNGRMKDFYDLYMISRMFTFDGATLTRAILATFGHRGTRIPSDIPIALREESAGDPDKVIQWKAFLNRSGLDGATVHYPQLIDALRIFLVQPLHAADIENPFQAKWPAGGPWSMSRTLHI